MAKVASAKPVAKKAPAAPRAPRCPEVGHSNKAGYVKTKAGRRPSAKGTQQRYLCTAPDGTTHLFAVPLPEDAPKSSKFGPKKPHHRRKHAVTCPKPSHADGTVRFKGTRTTKTGAWSRYQCVRPNKKPHYFSMLSAPSGSVVSSLAPPPPCPEHKDSTVVRNGTFARKRKDDGPRSVSRQHYRCDPGAEGKVHYFTTPLPREAVVAGEASCPICDELLSPHRGPLGGARHTPWTLKNIAQALNDLSTGGSYATVSMEMKLRRDQARAHILSHHEEEAPALLSAGLPESSSASWTTEQAKNSWHLAADLVEQYSPLFFNKLNKEMVARDAKQRQINDDALAANPGRALAAPIVWILDEQPITVYHRKSTRSGHQRNSWSVLVVVEMVWHHSKRKGDDDFPGAYNLPTKEARLRLVRAYPAGNELAWRLVLDELKTRPDFIISDCSGAILNAINNQYGAGVVGHIPSLFHIHRNVRDALLALPGASVSEGGRQVLVEPLSKRLNQLRRDEGLNLGQADWSDWWDGLIETVRDLPAPTKTLELQRDEYEDRVAAAFPILSKQPQLPASNASVETRIRLTLDDFTGPGRVHRYRNLARTNLLLDLAVCRSQGIFGDLDKVAATIRTDNEKAKGWAPLPRALDDAQPLLPPPPNEDGSDPGPPKSRKDGGPQIYSSLLNPFLLPVLAKKRDEDKKRAEEAGAQ